MSRIPAKCKQSVLCLSKNCSVSAVRGNTGRSSEESWWVGREDSCYWRASHDHATVTAKGCFWKAPWIISVSDLYKSTRLEVCVLCVLNCDKEDFKMCSEVRMMSAAAVSTLSSISSSISSCGSICDLWGVTYPSDFIPGGGGHWLQHHHHRPQPLCVQVEARN